MLVTLDGEIHFSEYKKDDFFLPKVNVMHCTQQTTNIKETN
jgi:hypothetical protein